MRTYAIIIGWLILAGSAVASSSPLMFPVPRGAETPSHVAIESSAAEQDYFWINAPYPATPALEHYSKVFAKWVPCKSFEAGWFSYGDTANGANRFVHQFVRNWISPNNDRAIVLLFQYASPGVAFRSAPDNDRQYVALVQYRVPDAVAFLAETKVICPNAPNRPVDADAQTNNARGSQ